MLGQHDCKTYTWVRNYLLQSYRDWKFPIDKSRARFHWSFSKLCDRNIFIIAATIKFSDNLSDYFQHIRVSKLNILVLITPTSFLSRPIPMASVKLSPQALRLGSITTGRDFYSNSDIYHIWTQFSSRKKVIRAWAVQSMQTVNTYISAWRTVALIILPKLEMVTKLSDFQLQSGSSHKSCRYCLDWEFRLQSLWTGTFILTCTRLYWTSSLYSTFISSSDHTGTVYLNSVLWP